MSNTAVDNMNVSKLCGVCTEPSDLKCSKCHWIYYCSREHQTSDWPSHKKNCCPVTIISKNLDNDCDRVTKVLVATRDIKQGEIILKEKPTMKGPSSNSIKPLKDPLNPNRIYATKNTICLGCSQDCVSWCSKCSWPVCNAQCENSPQHADFECKLFQKYSHKPEPYYVTEEGMKANTCLCVLRCLLLSKNDPERWQKITEIAENYKNNNDKFSYEPFGMPYTQAIEYVTQYLSQFELEFPGPIIESAFDAFYFNRIGSDDKAKNGIASIIYYKIHFRTQSCTQNVSTSMKTRDLQVRAVVDIKKGSEISYTMARTNEGTTVRLEKLKYAFGYICTCARCKDPTELGSFFNALKCPECENESDGYLVPKNPLLEDSDWVCKNPNCENQMLKMDIDIMYDSFKESMSLDALELNQLMTRKKLTDFIGKIEENVHRNHYLLFSLKATIMQQIGLHISEMRHQDVIDLMIDWGQDGLKLWENLSPGFSTFRGSFLCFWEKALAHQVYSEIRTLLSNKTKKDRDKMASMKEKFEKILQMREEAMKILEFEPDENVEMKMFREMKRQEHSKEFIGIRSYLDIKRN